MPDPPAAQRRAPQPDAGGAGRMPIGQLLGNLLRLFRAELAAHGEGTTGAEGVRPAHLHVFGAIKAGGSRLTDLAASSGLSLSTMAELVNGLERLGYLERRPDPSDGRAKLVHLTDAGWRAIRVGRDLIADIEHRWSAAVGAERYDSLADGMQALLDAIDPEVRARYATPPVG